MAVDTRTERFLPGSYSHPRSKQQGKRCFWIHVSSKPASMHSILYNDTVLNLHKRASNCSVACVHKLDMWKLSMFTYEQHDNFQDILGMRAIIECTIRVGWVYACLWRIHTFMIFCKMIFRNGKHLAHYHALTHIQNLSESVKKLKLQVVWSKTSEIVFLSFFFLVF